jgi:hypothetical protein
MADLDQRFRAARIVAIAMIHSLVIYAALVELIKQHFAPFTGFVQLAQLEVLRWVLLSVALVEVALIRVLRGVLLAPATPSTSTSFLALSLGLFAAYVPRRDRWEAWARHAPPGA